MFAPELFAGSRQAEPDDRSFRTGHESRGVAAHRDWDDWNLDRLRHASRQCAAVTMTCGWTSVALHLVSPTRNVATDGH